MSRRTEQLRRSGLSPSAARKPSLLDDWDIVRAARHMIELHGRNAAATAEHRAETADELHLVKRWKAIANTVRALEEAEQPQTQQAGDAVPSR